jgi:hypothetical protein
MAQSQLPDAPRQRVPDTQGRAYNEYLIPKAEPSRAFLNEKTEASAKPRRRFLHLISRIGNTAGLGMNPPPGRGAAKAHTQDVPSLKSL